MKVGRVLSRAGGTGVVESAVVKGAAACVGVRCKSRCLNT